MKEKRFHFGERNAGPRFDSYGIFQKSENMKTLQFQKMNSKVLLLFEMEEYQVAIFKSDFIDFSKLPPMRF